MFYGKTDGESLQYEQELNVEDESFRKVQVYKLKEDKHGFKMFIHGLLA